MKKKSMLVLIAVILLLGITVAYAGTWRECTWFKCGYGGAACEDGGWKILGCALIQCQWGGTIACPEPPPS